MNADETRLRGLLSGDARYAVPYFQRSYSWETGQWKTLWDDVHEVHEAGADHAHFLGSVVLLKQDGDAPFLIIDGQQRLVTLCLLLAAIRDMDANADLNAYLLREDRPRVQCTYQDQPAFDAVITGEGEPPFSRVTDAYRYFRTALGHEPELATLERTALDQLSFVAITLGAEDNPYRIFESLNAKGMPLTQGDLLRNYFFMRLPAEEHEDWHRRAWLPMQTLLGEGFDGFMQDALIKEGDFVRPDEVYQGWRARLGPMSPDEVMAVLRDLEEASHDYDRLLHPLKEPDLSVQKRLQRLTPWSSTTVYPFRPFLLKVYADYTHERLSREALDEILFAVESFLVRRLFLSNPPSDDNRLFLELYDGLSQRQGFAGGLARPELGWPDDGAFREAIVTCPLFFRSHPDQRKLVLQGLEESYPHRWEQPYDRLEIEFVAPLLSRPDWLAELGAGEDVHWRLVGTLGNLTWGQRGTSLSLTPAERKKELLAVARQGLELSRDLQGVSQWTAAAIGDRSRRLAERAMTVWPRPRR